jgi:hypothetical protein
LGERAAQPHAVTARLLRANSQRPRRDATKTTITKSEGRNKPLEKNDEIQPTVGDLATIRGSSAAALVEMYRHQADVVRQALAVHGCGTIPHTRSYIHCGRPSSWQRSFEPSDTEFEADTTLGRGEQLELFPFVETPGELCLRLTGRLIRDDEEEA